MGYAGQRSDHFLKPRKRKDLAYMPGPYACEGFEIQWMVHRLGKGTHARSSQ